MGTWYDIRSSDLPDETCAPCAQSLSPLSIEQDPAGDLRGAATYYVATSPIVATPCGGFKAWESEESEEGPEGRELRGEGRRPEQQQQREAAAAAAAAAREKRRRIRRLSYVILALLGAVIACRWVGIAAATAGDNDMPAIASSRDELRAVLKLAGIRAKPGQVEQAWSALRSGETVRTADLKTTPGGCGSGSASRSASRSASGSCSGSSSSSGGGKGGLAVKLALAEMFLEPTSLSFSMLAAAAMGVVAVVAVVTAAAVVVVAAFCCKPGRRVRRLEDARCANGSNGIAIIDGGKGRAERYQIGFDGSDGVIRPGGVRSGGYRR